MSEMVNRIKQVGKMMKMNKDKNVVERFTDISLPRERVMYEKVSKEMDERIELKYSEIEVQANPKRVGRMYKETPILIPEQESKKVEVQHISEEEYRYNPFYKHGNNQSKDGEKGRGV